MFDLLDPTQFEVCFQDWVESLRIRLTREVVDVGGKTVRRSHARGPSRRIRSRPTFRSPIELDLPNSHLWGPNPWTVVTVPLGYLDLHRNQLDGDLPADL